ncbi:NAD(P)-binding domain-containing protein [Streptosporangium sp. G12]
MTHDHPTPVTVLGLGPMGRALAGAFLANGHPTTVWNRTAARAEDLVARGAIRADTVADAVAASPLTIACVIDYDAVRAIVDPAADALKGRTLVNLTADTPERARLMAAWAAELGVDYLDGAIMTPTPTIGGPAAL